MVQTCSKSRSLAGARLGFALGSPALIADLNRIKFSFNPYNLNRLTILAGTAAMEDEACFQSCTARIRATRARVTERLRAMGFTVLDSRTNFVFVRPNAVSGGDYYAPCGKRACWSGIGAATGGSRTGSASPLAARRRWTSSLPEQRKF